MHSEDKRYFRSDSLPAILLTVVVRPRRQHATETETDMIATFKSQLLRAAAAAAVLAAVNLVAGTSAFAGDCPAGQMGVDVMKPGPMAPTGVTDTVISSIDLNTYGFKGRALRMRRLVIQPGGVVPWHSHGERPANILVVSGSVTEYRSTCSVPIEHGAGDVTAESGPLSHWWKNNTKEPAVLISSDILPPAKAADSMM